MFKKRSRPASVRAKAEEPEADPSSAATSGGEEEHESQTIAERLELRKLRRAEKQQGIDLEKFNRGEEKKRKKDPLDLQLDQFGLQMSAAGRRLKGQDDEPTDETEAAARKVRQNNFTQQTNALDVDKHMMAYIETEMAKRKGDVAQESTAQEEDPQAALYRLAENYKVKQAQIAEDEEGNMTNSLGMLSAIPEFDLGMDNRLRNIEETEKAKREMLARKAEEEEARKRGDDDDPLASMRFYRGPQRDVNIQREIAKGKREAAGLDPVQRRNWQQKPEMATDDQVYERFKKRMRR